MSSKRSESVAKSRAPARKKATPARERSRTGSSAASSVELAAPAKASARAADSRKKTRTESTPTPKIKRVRDRFSMPRDDFDLIAQLKLRAASLTRPSKKSEILRAGLYALLAVSDEEFATLLDGLSPRPAKG